MYSEYIFMGVVVLPLIQTLISKKCIACTPFKQFNTSIHFAPRCDHTALRPY